MKKNQQDSGLIKLRDTSEHVDSHRRRRKYYFFGSTLFGILCVALVSALLFIPLMTWNLMSIGWGIFFICYSFFIVIVDFVWFSTKYPPSHIKWRARKYFRKDRKYFEARNRRRERIRELVAKDPAQRKIYKDLFTKKMYILTLILLAFIIFAIWAIVEQGAILGGIFLIVAISIVIIVTIGDIFYENRIIRKKQEVSMERKRRDLRRYQRFHPDS